MWNGLMSRIVSIWFPAWSIERLARESPGSVPTQPFALVEAGPHGLVICAANAAALSSGVRIGASLADTRAAHPRLIARPAEAGRDKAALLRLARWLGRYGLHRHIDASDGAWIDVTGVPHLFGGEEHLVIDLIRRLRRIGITARVGLADTLGAAHALARVLASPPSPYAIAMPGATTSALAGLPSSALRLPPATAHLLRRLGLKRIGDLYPIPRSSLERRFRDDAKGIGRQAASVSANVLLRLDQALGRQPEVRRPLTEPPDLLVRLPLAEPLITSEGIEAALDHLADELAHRLEHLHRGARRFRFTLYRVDGTVLDVRIGTSTACRDALHVCRLLEEKLSSLDVGFGIDLLTLSAERLAPLAPCQVSLQSGVRQTRKVSVETFIDRVANRLGGDRILVPVRQQSHVPERSGHLLPAMTHLAARNPDRSSAAGTLPSPLSAVPVLLLSPPEAIDVLAEVPEGAPQRIRWRRVFRRIVRAQGPDRVYPDWWSGLLEARASSESGGGAASPRTALIEQTTRDYYRLEDETGTNYWVFRAGLYTDSEKRTSPPAWFMHGVFS
jgi:protein ImuB